MINNTQFPSAFKFDQSLFDKVKEVVMPSYKKANEKNELRWSLQVDEFAIPAATRMAASIHGKYPEGIPDLQPVAGTAQNEPPALTQIARLIQQVETGEATEEEVDTKIRRINKTIFKTMNAGLLRYYVDYIRKQHPALAEYIDANVRQYQYFGPITEELGTFYRFVHNEMDTPLENWTTEDVVSSQDPKTPWPMRKRVFAMMPTEVVKEIEKANAKANELVKDIMGVNSFLIAFPEYTEAIPHGLDQANDQLFNPIVEEAKEKIYDKLKKQYKDRLRLLDAYFPFVAEYVIQMTPTSVEIGGKSVQVDGFGEKKETEFASIKDLTYDDELSKTEKRS